MDYFETLPDYWPYISVKSCDILSFGQFCLAHLLMPAAP